MKEITIKGGAIAIVDDEVYPLVSRWKWKPHRQGYACRTVTGGSIVLMHRQILGDPDSDVDHENGNKLDNRRSNLRLATRSQNMHNRGKQRNNSSGRKGVVWDPERGLWRATICVGRKHRFIGRFDTMDEAARAYDHAAKALVGEFAGVNGLAAGTGTAARAPDRRRVSAISGYRGVCRVQATGRWRCYVTVNRRRKYLGTFATAIEARDAREAWLRSTGAAVAG